MNTANLALALTPGLAAWFAPATLHYRRGSWAVAGAVVSIVLLAASMMVARTNEIFLLHRYSWLALLLAPFVAAGLGSCLVALRDGRPAAVATLAVLLAAGAAAMGAGAWSWLFLAGGAALAIGLARTTPPPPADERTGIVAANQTRRARSIVRKLVREGKFHWLPVYFVIRLSDLAREGIERSGSYRFADHIYRMTPSGRGLLGRWIDRRFLNLKATRAFHHRYKQAQVAMRTGLESFAADGPVRLLAIPCGLPRDLTELAATLRVVNPALLAAVDYTGMDIDPELLRLAADFTQDSGVPRRAFVRGNALVAGDFPAGGFHVIVSTGLGEFLADAELETFYENVHRALCPGGTFYTSATAHDPSSDAFMQAFELKSHYRTPEQLAVILGRCAWSRLEFVKDETGLQTFVTAVK